MGAAPASLAKCASVGREALGAGGAADQRGRGQGADVRFGD
jgi:hypothetical protein